MTQTIERAGLDGAGAGDSQPRGSNQKGLRAHNERLVLTLIRRAGALPKAEIARITGLSAQTVSVIMRALEQDGLLRKGEPVRGKVGQPSVPMSLHKDGAFFLGLKIGRRGSSLIMTDFLGDVRGRLAIAHQYPTPDGVVRFANDGAARLIGDLPRPFRDRIAGMGVAMPFRLWEWAAALGAEPAQMAEWKSRNIAAELAERWRFPVYDCNDGSAACGAELVYGDQDKPSDFLYFFVGFFIGGGLVLDNSLYTGRSGNAAALGSVPVAVNGEPARQLVDLASLSALEAAIVAEGGDAGSLWGDLNGWSVPEAALERWLDEAAAGIAAAINSSACLIDFGCAVIDGWLPDDVRAELVSRTRARVLGDRITGVDPPEVREGTIGGHARSLGAASLPLSERFLVDRSAFSGGSRLKSGSGDAF